MSCVNGDIDKYKSNVKLESSKQQTVWVGVTARPSIYYYICTKNSDGSMSSFFIDQKDKNQFDSAIKSYIYSEDYQNLRTEERTTFSIEYVKVDENLVIRQDSDPKNSITLDKTMVYAYWGKHWLLERFKLYLQKRIAMLQYSEYILDILAKYDKDTVTKDDFVKMFETSSPPNRIFTSQEMWHYFLKRKLGY